MDLKYDHRSEIYALSACLHDDAADLVALGGDHSVDVLLVTETDCRCIASFHVGLRVTALAWSSSSISPSTSDEWTIELAAACSDFGLHLLTKTSSADEHIFPFGGGLSGHHGKINGISFCGGWGKDSSRYVATVSDDKVLMIWDLHPTIEISSNLATPIKSPETDDMSSSTRPQPTAYVIAFPHPLVTISSHPSTSKEFLVSDCRGSIFLTDWRSDPEDGDRSNLRHSSLIELVEPHALSASTMGVSTHWGGSIAWKEDTPDIIGAVYGSKVSLWDISNLRGGTPFLTIKGFPEGGHRFRWCQTYPEYFAISTQSPNKGALIQVYNVNFLQAHPTVFNLYSRPRFVRDFDFLASRGIPRIVAAIGRTAVIFPIGIES